MLTTGYMPPEMEDEGNKEKINATEDHKGENRSVICSSLPGSEHLKLQAQSLRLHY